MRALLILLSAIAILAAVDLMVAVVSLAMGPVSWAARERMRRSLEGR